MKSNCVFQRPSTFDKLGNGTYHYNYNVVESVKTDPETGAETPNYDYDQVVIVGTPTYDKVVAAVIRDKYTIDKELALINNYNRYQAAADEDKEAEDLAEYEAYLTDRANIKAMVKTDCKANNITIE